MPALAAVKRKMEVETKWRAILTENGRKKQAVMRANTVMQTNHSENSYLTVFTNFVSYSLFATVIDHIFYCITFC
jgi:hypothetical protein